MAKMSQEEAAGLNPVSGTCRYCGQMRTVWAKNPDEYSQEDIDKIASSECNCPGAVKKNKLDQLINSGLEAIRMTLTDKHRKNAGEIMKTGLRELCTQRIRKISVQIDRETTATMYLAKVKKETGDADIRVIVECKTTVMEWSDGEQELDE